MPDRQQNAVESLLRFILETQGPEAAKQALAQIKAVEPGPGADRGPAPNQSVQVADDSNPRPPHDLDPAPEGAVPPAPTASPPASSDSGSSAGGNADVPEGLFQTDSRVADILQAAATAKAASDKELVAALQNILSTQQELQRAIGELKSFNTNSR